MTLSRSFSQRIHDKLLTSISNKNQKADSNSSNSLQQQQQQQQLIQDPSDCFYAINFADTTDASCATPTSNPQSPRYQHFSLNRAGSLRSRKSASRSVSSSSSSSSFSNASPVGVVGTVSPPSLTHSTTPSNASFSSSSFSPITESFSTFQHDDTTSHHHNHHRPTASVSSSCYSADFSISSSGFIPEEPLFEEFAEASSLLSLPTGAAATEENADHNNEADQMAYKILEQVSATCYQPELPVSWDI